jgi:hypothetical protein
MVRLSTGEDVPLPVDRRVVAELCARSLSGRRFTRNRWHGVVVVENEQGLVRQPASMSVSNSESPGARCAKGGVMNPAP